MEITSFLSMLNRFGEEKSALLVETFGRLLRQLSGFMPQEYLLEKLHTSAVSQVSECGVRLPAPYVKGDRGKSQPIWALILAKCHSLHKMTEKGNSQPPACSFV